MARRDQGLIALQQRQPLPVQVDICCIGNVVAVLFQPHQQVQFPVQKIPGTVAPVGTIKRDLYRARCSGNCVGTIAVEDVETFANTYRKRIIGLIGGYRLLVEKISDAIVIPHGKNNVVVETFRIGQFGQIDTTGPVGGDRQGITVFPWAEQQPGVCIHYWRWLWGAAQCAAVMHQAAAVSLIPAHPEHLDVIGLRRINRDVEGNLLTLVDAGGRSEPLDLLISIACPFGKTPLAGAGITVFYNDRILFRIDRWRDYSKDKNSK